MIISEARQVYAGQIKAYREQQGLLEKKKQELEKRIENTVNGKDVYAKEAAILELTTEAVRKKRQEYESYMEKVQEKWAAVSNMVASDQQAEAMKEYVEDLGKIMEVARRLMKGGIVPPDDEKKLMEYSMELYQAAKNIGAMAKEREEYDSLWKEKKDADQPLDPAQEADNSQAPSGGPAIVDVADTMASVPGAAVPQAES